jgi:hypothetical protein
LGDATELSYSPHSRLCLEFFFSFPLLHECCVI